MAEHVNGGAVPVRRLHQVSARRKRKLNWRLALALAMNTAIIVAAFIFIPKLF